MPEKENVQVVTKWIEAVNAHDASRFEQYRAPAYLSEIPIFPGPVGVDEEVAYSQGLFEAFPDLHVDIKQTIAQGDFVVAELTFAGTHEGPLTMPGGPTVPPTGKKVVVPVSNTFKFADGKVARNSLYYDQMTMMAQLGLAPGM